MSATQRLRAYLPEWTLVSVKLGLHLGLVERYGIHRDELYFIECANHLAAGYVDHAPLVPWLVAGVRFLFGESLFALRLLPALAGGAAVLLTLMLVRRLGGGMFARWLAGLAVILAPAYLRMHGLMHLPAFELVIWTANALLLLHLFAGGSGRWWFAVGLLTGQGLLNKHTMLLWGASLAIALAATRSGRSHLKQPYVWLAGVIALVLVVPHLIWQAGQGWPTLEFIRNQSAGFARRPARLEFVLGQFLYIGPAAAPIWIAGVAFLLRHEGSRVLALLFSLSGAALLVTGGKPYYLAAAYPPLLAAGAVWWERRLFVSRTVRVAPAAQAPAQTPQAAHGHVVRPLALAGFVLLGTITAVPGVPLLPLPMMNRYITFLLGPAVPDPVMLTHDFHDQYGWRDQARTVARVVRKQRGSEGRGPGDRVAVLAANYGEAAAFNAYRAVDLPRAYSGHMSFYLWGPPPEQATSFVAVGFSRAFLESQFLSVEEAARSDHPLAHPKERNLPIYVCMGPRVHPARDWLSYRKYYFGEVRPEIRVPKGGAR